MAGREITPDKVVQESLKIMARDPYEQYVDSLPVTLSGPESAKQVLSRLGTVQSNRAIMELFNKTEKPKARKGIVSTLLDPEKGLLFAPARFSSALLADVLDLAQDTDEGALKKYNPLESAIKSARGEFAITGGDVIKVKDRDNALARGGKLIGALAWDVLTDPTSYVGGVGTLSKRSIIETAANPATMRRVLKDIEETVLENQLGRQFYDDIFERLVASNRNVQNGTYLIDQAAEAEGIFKLIDSRTQRALTEDELKDIASSSLSLAVSEGLQTRGRAGVLDNLRDVIGKEGAGRDIADQVFQKHLPRELSGGLYLINPITGKRLKRIAGGKGTGNPVKEVLNAARYKTSRALTGLTKEASGEFGPTYAAAIRDLSPEAIKTKGWSRTLLTDYVEFKDKMRLKKQLAEQFSEAGINATRRLVRTSESLEKSFGKDARELFDGEVSEYAYRAGAYDEDTKTLVNARDTDGMTSLEYARHMAEWHGIQIAEMFKYYRQQMLDAGIELGEQEMFFPLMRTAEAVEYLNKIAPVQGKEAADIYSGTRSRRTFAADELTGPVSDAELDELVGEAKRPGQRYRSPKEVNAVVKLPNIDKVFEENAVTVVARYVNWAANKLAITRTINALELTGVVTRFDDVAIEFVNAANAEALLAATKTLDTTARAKLKAVRDATDAKLASQLDPDAVRVENNRRRRFKAAAQKEYDRLMELEADVMRRLDTNQELLDSVDLQDPRVVSGVLSRLDLDPAAAEALKKSINELNDAKSRMAASAKRRKAARAQYTRLRNAEKKLQDLPDKVTYVTDPVTKKRTRVVTKAATQDQLDRAAQKTTKAEQALLAAEEEFNKHNESVKFWTSQQDAAQPVFDAATAQGVTEVQELMGAFITYSNMRTELLAELAQTKLARENAWSALQLAKVEAKKLSSQTIQKTILALMETTKNLREFQNARRNIPLEQWTEAEVQQLRVLKEARKAAEQRFVKATGYAGKNAPTSAQQAYVKSIYDLAMKLTAQDMRVATFFADPDLIDRHMAVLMNNTTSHAVRMQAIKDIVESYKYLRRNNPLTGEPLVTYDDLKNLEELQRRVFEGTGKEIAVSTRVGPITARHQILLDDRARALARGDALEVKVLDAEIKRLENFMEKDRMSMVGAGVKDFRAPSAMHNLYAPEGVRETLERMFKLEEDPSGWKRYIKDFYDPLAFLWKTQATVGRGPAYIFNNILGGSANNYLYGVTVKEHWDAARMLRALDEAVEKASLEVEVTAGEFNVRFNELVTKYAYDKLKDMKVGDKRAVDVLIDFYRTGSALNTETRITLQDMFSVGGNNITYEQLTDRHYGLSAKWSSEARSVGEENFRKFIDFWLTNPVQRVFNDLAQKSEAMLRLAAYMHGYKKFGNSAAALNLVYALHFDYRDLSGAEQWVKRIAPFYTWTRNNVPLQMRALFFQTDKIKKMVLINENFKKAFGPDEDDSWINDLLPEWMDVQGGFMTRFGLNGNPLGLFPKLPIYDLDQTSQMVSIYGFPMIAPRWEEFAQMLGPAVTPIEFLVGVNFDTGIKYQDEGEKWSRISTNLAPLVGTIKRAARGATVPLTLAGVELPKGIAQERGLSDLINFMVGTPYGAVTLTEKTLMSGLITTLESQNAQVQAIADEAGIDLDWLRKQVRSGKSLVEIRELMSKGEGSVAAVAAAKKAKGYSPLSRDYEAVIEGLQTGEPLTGY